MAPSCEPTASRRLKVRRHAEVLEQDEHLPLFSMYGHRLAIDVGVRSSRFLVALGAGGWDSQFGLLLKKSY